MSDDTAQQYVLFMDLPVLTEDERDDARFRGKDLAWSVLSGLYDERVAEESITFEMLGTRIGRSKQQVQRWIDSPHNMTLQSLSLLAEGLDADLMIDLPRRAIPKLTNMCHPADEAQSDVAIRLFIEGQHRLQSAVTATLGPSDKGFVSWGSL